MAQTGKQLIDMPKNAHGVIYVKDPSDIETIARLRREITSLKQKHRANEKEGMRRVAEAEKYIKSFVEEFEKFKNRPLKDFLYGGDWMQERSYDSIKAKLKREAAKRKKQG